MKNTVLFKIKRLLIQQVSQNIKQSVTCSHLLIHSLWISFFTFNSFILTTLTHRRWSLTRFDNFKVSSKDALSVLLRTSGNLGILNISCSMVGINTPASAASLNARVSEANGLYVTLLRFYDDQHIGVILFILPQTKMIKPPCEDPSLKLA